MIIRNLDYAIFAIAIAATYFGIAIYAWRQRTVPGASALAILTLAAGEYAIAYILQLGSLDLPNALFWYNVSVPGASILGPIWLVFAVQYAQQSKILTRNRLILLALIPALSCLMAWTNPLHGLYGSDFSFDAQAAWPALVWKFGLFYWINFGYAYLTTALGAIILFRMAFKRWRFFMRQTAFLLAGILLPILLNIGFVISGYSPIPHLDIAPFSFLITGITWSLAIFRFRFLDLVPIAHDRVFETMPIGVIVLDQQDRVVDFNPAAVQMLAPSASITFGQNLPPAVDVFQTHTGGLPVEGEHREIWWGPATGPSYLLLHLSPLFNRARRATGSLLLIQDATQRKQAELAEQEQRILTDTVRNATADLSRSLKLEDVLSLVLANMSRIVPYTAAHIVLLDKSGQKALLSSFRFYEPEISPAVDKAAETCPEPDCPAEILTQMYENARPFHLLEASIQAQCLNCAANNHARAAVRDSVGVPMRVYGNLIGFAVLDSALPEHFTPVYLERLDSFFGQAAIAVENARLYAELAEQAIRDELTGAFNRRGFLNLAQRTLDNARRAGTPCAVVLFDLDHFKQINDRHGHAAGDQVLRTVVRKCLGHIRDVDALGRLGGDEFAIVLPDCTAATAHLVCERLRKEIESHFIRTKSGQLGVTLSMGIAVDSGEPQTLADLLSQADRAMYAAKEAGSNCVR